MMYFNYNGKFFPAGTAIIGADNRGLRYGDGLFETIKILNNHIVAEAAHFSRLWNGMQVLGFDIPRHFTKDWLRDEVMQLISKNGVGQAARVRLSVLRGDGGLYDATNHKPNYIIQCWPLAPGIGDWNSNGIVAGIYREAKKSCDSLSNIKHNNYLPYIMAALDAKKNKWNDAVVLNTNDRVADTTIANVFLIKDEVVCTPPLSEGGVAGVIRIQLIQHLLDNSFKIEEKPVTVEALLSADEVFFTNSIHNIRWVQSVNEQVYGNALTQKIFASFIPTIS